MSLLGIVVMIIFVAMAVSSFYFWSKSQGILSKYLTLKDSFQFWRIRDIIPESEWKLYKKYRRNQFWCFFGGTLLIMVIYLVNALLAKMT